MKRIVGCKEMKELDHNTIEIRGVPSCVLMERAALQVVKELEEKFERNALEEKILCVCGNGNNGGDGVAVARILRLHGYKADIYLIGNPEHRTQEMKRQLLIADNYHVPVVNNLEEQEYTTIVDAIFGVGLTRPVEGMYADLIHRLNRMNAWKVAVDLPSGVNGDTGAVLGTAFQADLTVTFAYRKAGLCLYPGRKIAGNVVVADVGIYGTDSQQSRFWQLNKEDLSLLPEKAIDGNKGTFGKILIVAGSPGMCGAAYLSASGAFAVGAGMVKIVTTEANRIPLQTMLPEAMLFCGDDFESAFEWCDILVIGPGLGMTSDAERKVQWFLEAAAQSGKRVVLDADGLNLLAEHPEWKAYLGEHVVLTPHMGEMSRLTGDSIEKLQNDRVGAARRFVEQTGAVCVLKDACTLAVSSDGRVWFSLYGNPGMATAGSGDVLSGIIAGIMCMYRSNNKISLGQQAAVGVMIHGLGGDQAAQDNGMAGMKAGDIAKGVSTVLKNREDTRISDEIR